MGSSQTLTVLFCDCVDSTARQTRIGDIAADEFWRQLSTLLRTSVEECGGYVVKNLGDGIMAVFERSTIGAIECASLMHERARSLDPDDPVHLRIGISAGEAAPLDRDWYGTPIVEGARLCAAAGADQTLATSVVVSLVGSRADSDRFRSVGRLELKGLPGPVDVVDVDGEGVAPASAGGAGGNGNHSSEKRRWRPRGSPTVWLTSAAAVVALAMVVTLLATRGDDDSVSTDRARAGKIGVTAPVGYAPKLEPTPCADDLTTNVPEADCSVLIVPESRNDPKGASVSLPVVHIPHPNGSKTDPVVLVDVNEPVERTSMRDAADVYSLAIRGLAGTSDVPRPGGNTDVPLRCDDLAGVWTDALAERADDKDSIQRKADAAGTCSRTLTSEGVDLTHYSMADISLDIRDLIVALQLEQVSLVAGGPTSTAAIAFTRSHPGAVNALVLTNPTPPGASTQAEPARTVSKQFEHLVDLCTHDPKCAQNFPALATDYKQRYEQLAAAPMTVTTKALNGQGPFTVLLDGRRLAAALEAGLQASSQIGLLPAALTGASPELIASAALNEDVGFYISPTTKNGAFLALTCSYDAEQNQTAEVSDAALAQFAGANDAAFGPACASFDVPSVFDTLSHPLDVDVPVLLAVGGFAVSGINGWADQMAGMLPDVTVAKFDTMSEDLSYAPPSCLRGLRTNFVIDPKAPRDVAACEKQSPPIEFVGPA